MISRVDSEDYNYQVLTEVTDNKRDYRSITKLNGFIESIHGNLYLKRNTWWCKLLLEWKNESVYWVPLEELKQSSPIELAEYSVSNKISDEPSFRCWVKEALRRWDTIIFKVKSNYCPTSHNFGIQAPKTVKEAYEIDSQSGTDFQNKAISK